jgi:hypothetical protein
MRTTISTLQMPYPQCQSHVDQDTAKLIVTRQDSGRATSTPYATLARAPKQIIPADSSLRRGLASSLSLRSPNQSGSIQIPIPSDSTPSGMVAPMWADLLHHIFGTAPLADSMASDSMASTSNDNAGTQFLLQLEHENEAYVEKRESVQTTTPTTIRTVCSCYFYEASAAFACQSMIFLAKLKAISKHHRSGGL